jgi:hypothetical protein
MAVHAYSSRSIERIKLMEPGEFNEVSIGLSRICVEAKISPLNISRALGVTRQAANAWLHGGIIAEPRRPKVKRFIEVVKNDLESGVLPKTKGKDVIEYVESLRQVI